MEIIKDLSSYMDHTFLKQTATAEDISRICDEAVKFGFATVCVNPCHVKQAAKILGNENIGVCSVIGFPLGSSQTEVKMVEAMRAVENGADELDMVVNIGALKEGDLNLFLKDIFLTVQGAGSVPVKAIIETGCLTDEEKKTACKLAVTAGASYVKTCTGFGPGKAEVSDIKLMRETVGPDIGVKASGGIKTYKQAIALIEAGASRIGASASIDIVKGIRND
ncbi:deoxyribose-phosphate aldolase [Maridesulfovibrio bastinii]|uniref:deoxyribose-phosphate aldolase n=1 Tax=Maridesulfovibrio bastinii TaxID=47157 RepID=UPI0003F66D1C|nr:deoxyribose-phosphate aldolase [Maridesulfovibrio bastinii]